MQEHDEFMLAYQDSCGGPTLLLIHGFPLNSNLWEPQLEDLNDSARVLAPDLRGHGLSGVGNEEYSMGLMADDCMGLLEALGVQGPVIVCGLSMGGYVAFEFYRRFPEMVAGFILVATRAGADSPEARQSRDQMIKAVKKVGAEAVVTELLPKFMAAEAYERDEELVSFVRDMMETVAVDGIIGALQAMKERPDSTPMLAEIDVPTLIIYGADDQIISLEEVEAMRDAIIDADLVIIEDAGHLPNLEQPAEFNEAVWEYLETIREEMDFNG